VRKSVPYSTVQFGTKSVAGETDFGCAEWQAMEGPRVGGGLRETRLMRVGCGNCTEAESVQYGTICERPHSAIAQVKVEVFFSEAAGTVWGRSFEAEVEGKVHSYRPPLPTLYN
jgi:hypothetical protein